MNQSDLISLASAELRRMAEEGACQKLIDAIRSAEMRFEQLIRESEQTSNIELTGAAREAHAVLWAIRMAAEQTREELIAQVEYLEAAPAIVTKEVE